ncbi:hypothetical protein ACFQU1_05805 [Chelatococcus sp. GCM10030263]|uniref:hypothetical protein n=1 Tax=Chelatococcus sp. GCM10030263 TaxID=3273387 RepID=UPI0036124E51
MKIDWFGLRNSAVFALPLAANAAVTAGVVVAAQRALAASQCGIPLPWSTQTIVELLQRLYPAAWRFDRKSLWRGVIAAPFAGAICIVTAVYVVRTMRLINFITDKNEAIPNFDGIYTDMWRYYLASLLGFSLFIVFLICITSGITMLSYLIRSRGDA